MKRLLRILAAILAALLLLMAAAALWLRSEAALRYAVSVLESRSGGAIKVGEAEGTLFGPFTLKDVRLDAKDADAEVASLTLEWSPIALLTGAVQVHDLEVQGVSVHLKTARQSAPLSFPLHPPVMPLLPVRIALQQVRVRDTTLYKPDGEVALHLDSADFAGRVSNRSIALRQLKAEGPSFSVQGEAELATRRGYETHADLTWRWQPQNLAALAGRSILDGDAKRLDLTQTLASPYALDLKATLKDAFTAPSWSGELKVTRLAAAAIRPGTPGYAAGGSLRFRGDLKGTVIKGAIQADSPTLGPLDARVDTLLDERRVEFRTLSLKLAKSGTALDMKGVVELSTGAPATLTGTWRNANWPGAPWLDSPMGRLRLDTDAARLRLKLVGTLAPQGDFDAQLEIARTEPHRWTLTAGVRDMQSDASLSKPWMDALLPTGDWQASAHGDIDSAHIDKLAGDWLGGRVSAQGLYTRATGRWQAEMRLQGADTGLLSDDWQGKVDATVSASGGGEVAPLDLRLESLRGVLRDKPLSATGHLHALGKQVEMLSADAALGDNRLHLDADQVGGEKLAWRLDAGDLSQVWPDAAGTLHTQGQLQADSHATLLQFVLDGQALVWQHYRAGTLHAEAHVSGETDAHASVSAQDLSLAGIQVTRLDTQADGSLEKHAVRLDLSSDDGVLHLAGTGDYADEAWHGSLDEVELDPKGAGRWQALAPWALDIVAHGFSLTSACLQQADAQACGKFDWRAGGWRSHAEITRLPLTDLQATLPSGLSYAGSLHALFDGDGGRKDAHLALDAELTPGSVQNLVNGKELTLLAYKSGEAHLHVTPTLTSASIGWQLTDGGNLDLAAQVQRGKHPTLTGHIRGQFDDFQLLPAMIPQLGSASGRLALDVALSGTPDAPQFDGSADFDDGDLTVPRLGIHMQDVSLHLKGDAAELSLSGAARSGGGSLALSGTGRRTGSTWQADGALKGDGFRMVDIPEAQVDVSPDLAFKLDDRDVRVSGAVTIPYARLRPRNLTSTAQVSPDQVIVGEEGGEPQEKWHVHAAVHVSMGKQVDFEGFGLSGSIGGDVLAVDEPGHITTGSGELTIQNGLYAAYGQKLQIDNGRLLFNGGPISDPALDIRALRAAAHPEMLQPGSVDQKVGVVVRGTLRAPKVTLFADPPLPQAQLTNYLLFGSTGLETSATTAGSVPGGAGNTATSSQGADIPDFSMQLGAGNGSFDVSKQNVQTTSGVQTASLFFGKYLSPRLYISYGVGLYDPITVKRLIYKLSEKWTLQAESGAANSADIIYTLEH